MVTVMVIVVLCFSNINGAKIKIVEGPFSFNNPAAGLPAARGESGDMPLIARVLAAVPSGPKFLIDNLYGRCFDTVIANYKYVFCPFQNITQREQSYRWNAFHGILGIWKEWEVVNDTLQSMLMVHGDVCSPSLDRQVKVYVQCGNANEIVSVKEPSTCRYDMKFATPYACAKDVFYVYPLLSPAGRLNYRNCEEAYLRGDITLKGYNKRRENLFIREGLKIKEEVKRSIGGNNALVTLSKTTIQIGTTETLNNNFVIKNQRECDKKYQTVLLEKNALLEEVKKLREALRMRTVLLSNITTFPATTATN